MNLLFRIHNSTYTSNHNWYVCIQRFAKGPPNRHLIYTAGEDFHYQVISHDLQPNIYDMKNIDFTKKKT